MRYQFRQLASKAQNTFNGLNLEWVDFKAYRSIGAIYESWLFDVVYFVHWHPLGSACLDCRIVLTYGFLMGPEKMSLTSKVHLEI